MSSKYFCLHCSLELFYMQIFPFKPMIHIPLNIFQSLASINFGAFFLWKHMHCITCYLHNSLLVWAIFEGDIPILLLKKTVIINTSTDLKDASVVIFSFSSHIFKRKVLIFFWRIHSLWVTLLFQKVFFFYFPYMMMVLLDFILSFPFLSCPCLSSLAG